MKFLASFARSHTFTGWVALSAVNLRFLILTPLVLSLFVIEEIALWFYIAALNGFILFFSKGLSASLIRIIAHIHAGGKSFEPTEVIDKNEVSVECDPELLKSLFASLGRIFIYITSVTALVSIVLVAFSLNSLAGDLYSENQLLLIISITVINIAVMTFGKMYYVVYMGLDKVADYNRLNTVFIIVSTLISVAVMLISQSFLHLFLASQLVNIIFILTTSVSIHRYLKNKLGGVSFFGGDKTLFKSAWNPTWKSSISSFAYQGSLQGAGIIYAQWGDPTAVASFLLAVRVISMLGQISNMPFASRIPYLVRKMSQGKLPDMQAFFQSRLNIVLITLAIGIISVGVFIQPVLELIDSKADWISIEFWYLMGGLWLLDRVNAMFNALQNATNNIIYHWHHLAAFIISMILYVPISAHNNLIGIILAQNVPRLMIFRTQLISRSSKLIAINAYDIMFKVLSPIMLGYVILAMVHVQWLG